MKRVHFVAVATLFIFTAFMACGDKPTEPESGSLSITSDPSGARIYLGNNDTKQITLHTFKEIDVGTYAIKLQLQHYENWDSSVVVQKDKTTTVHATLFSATGSIEVNSEPSGASIYIDRAYRGITPLTIEYVSIGNHEVKLSLADYADWIHTIHVVRDSTTAVEATLLKLVGGLSVTSEPTGASVWLDGTELGTTTPATIDNLLATTHQLKLTLADYQDYEQEVTVIAFDTVAVHADLTHQTGSIIINSDPAGALIYLDGAPTNQQTPATLTGLSTGGHTLRLERDEYLPWDSTVIVLADQTISIFADLKSQNGALSITSSPSGACVYLDGANTGRITPVSFTGLIAKSYVVQLTLPLYLDWDTTVMVTGEDTLELHAALTETPTLLVMLTDPPGAAVIINSETLDSTTPDTLELTPGTYQVGLRYLDHFPIDSTIVILKGHTHVLSGQFQLCPDYTIFYPDGDRIWGVDLDGFNLRTVGYDPFYSSITTSPNWQYIAYKKKYTLPVITPDGNIMAEPAIQIWSSFNWSHSSQKLVILPWGGTIQIFDITTQITTPVLNTYRYTNNPTFSFGDSLISYVKHLWGSHAWINLICTDGTGHKTVSQELRTSHDEELQLKWISGHEILFKANGGGENNGIFLLDLNSYNDGNPVAPTRVIADRVIQLKVSPNYQYFAYTSPDNGLVYGKIGDWTPHQLHDVHLACSEYLAWSPGNDALVYRTGDGIYWVTLSGQHYRVVQYYPLSSCKHEGLVTVAP